MTGRRSHSLDQLTSLVLSCLGPLVSTRNYCGYCCSYESIISPSLARTWCDHAVPRVDYDFRADWMPLKSSYLVSELVSVTETCLRQLEFKFVRNETKGMVEFDVTEPATFLVRITQLQELEHPSPIFGLLLTGRQSACTDLSVVLDPIEVAARIRASELIKAILSSLQEPPWKGLGVIESLTSKALWTRYARGLE